MIIDRIDKEVWFFIIGIEIEFVLECIIDIDFVFNCGLENSSMVIGSV